MKRKILLIAPIQSQSGYGSRSRDLLHALSLIDDYDVYCIPTRWGSGNTVDFREVNNGQTLFEICRKILPPKFDVLIQCTIPTEFLHTKLLPSGLEYDKAIGITAGIETTKPPATWIEGCNRMDAVMFSSETSLNIFRE